MSYMYVLSMFGWGRGKEVNGFGIKRVRKVLEEMRFKRMWVGGVEIDYRKFYWLF